MYPASHNMNRAFYRISDILYILNYIALSDNRAERASISGGTYMSKANVDMIHRFIVKNIK